MARKFNVYNAIIDLYRSKTEDGSLPSGLVADYELAAIHPHWVTGQHSLRKHQGCNIEMIERRSRTNGVTKYQLHGIIEGADFSSIAECANCGGGMRPRCVRCDGYHRRGFRHPTIEEAILRGSYRLIGEEDEVEDVNE